MFCSGCGQAVAPGQGVCSQCGRPVAAPVPAVPGFQYQLENYAGKIKMLGIFWFVYAALVMTTGLAGLAFASAFLSGLDERPLGTRSDASLVLRTCVPEICLGGDRNPRRPGSGGRMGSDGALGLGANSGHRRRVSERLEIPLRDRHGHLDSGDAAGLPEHDALWPA